MPKKVVIVGGVAGGASCAARLRRMDEQAEITLLERGPFVSFANCGLPYYVGDVIHDEKKLLLATPELFRDRFKISVLVGHEAVSIDRAAKNLEVKGPEGTLRMPYDVLVLSTGASPIRPHLPGIDLPGIFPMRNIPDSRLVREWIKEKEAKRAVVVGGGFIGLEMAENLRHRGLEVDLLEAGSQVLPPLDPEMAALVHPILEANGVKLHLNDPVAGFEKAGKGLKVRTGSGKAFEADLVMLSIGVRPETALAEAAGLELGERGGVKVDEYLRTSDPSIYAVGDMVEVKDYVTGHWGLVPLAGPANRMGRLAADAIAGKPRPFRGVQGTAVCGFFGSTAAFTGASEKTLKRAGIGEVVSLILHPGNHAGYYPGAKTIHLKVLFSPSNGKILGAQAVGSEGVEKRIDVIAMALQLGGKVTDLEEAELCYAPQYGSAKDPVNLAGMAASNVLRGDVELADWQDLPPSGGSGPFLLDVRNHGEVAAGAVPEALNIPLNDLRGRLSEVPKNREVWVFCAAGLRSYIATRILKQNGYRVRNLPGGYQAYRMFHPEPHA